ncbi:hypothetical protein [Deinococcus yavapaiensis]|uniref:Lipopolysaccharide export system protein LptA n=1 Tax=Deinococcus yavapaiensis KR-236 TaxID=694435 RepID=A0A318S8B8_9DEIO|nr:hypothetical protein [Deinococcus yavapaiensis]PYE54775.1 hypothetical protein DES52_10445 [Deinococcus yavapaiensis KR-236]
MKRLVVTMLAALGIASAATFAGFQIKPYGNQKLNLQTGATVLEAGGVATDAERGVTVDARYIEFKDGAWLRARGAKLTTEDGGALSADNVEYSAAKGDLTAKGNLVYNDSRVRGLTAASLTLEADSKIVSATGSVKSVTPIMQADTVVVDYQHRRAVMRGNYRYSFGGTRLGNARPDAVLLVTWDGKNKPVATSRPNAAIVKQYEAYWK